jgi:hypothetical protein
MKNPSLIRLAGGCALALLGALPVLGQTAGDHDFQGKIGKTLADSEQYWPAPLTPP